MPQEDRDEFDIASGSALGSELSYQVFMLFMLGVACLLKLVSRHCVSAVFELYNVYLWILLFRSMLGILDNHGIRLQLLFHFWPEMGAVP